MLGILVATTANHALAGAVGAWVTTVIGPQVLRWILGLSFIAMAVWMLIPDKLDDDETGGTPRFGVFGTTVVAFFLAEMGDKTQVATVMLAAQYSAYFWVVAGTTLGMMLANAPVVWLGERITRRVRSARCTWCRPSSSWCWGSSRCSHRRPVLWHNCRTRADLPPLAGAL